MRVRARPARSDNGHYQMTEIMMSMRAKLFAAALSLAAASAPAMAASGDASDLLQALQVERQRAVVQPLPRRDFVLRYAVSAVTLSPDGRQLAWLRERGNSREVWMQSTAGDKPKRLLERTAATDLAWTRDARWLLLESSRQLFALAVAGQTGSGIVTTLGGRDGREFQRVDATRPASIFVLEALGRDASGQPKQWQLVRVDVHGKRSLLHRDSARITGYALDARGQLAWLQRLQGNEQVTAHMDQGRWHEVLRCGALHHCTPLATTGPRGDLLLRGDGGPDNPLALSRLLRLDTSGTLSIVDQDARGEADIDRVGFDLLTGQPLTVAYRSSVPSLHGLDDETRAHLARIDAQLSQQDLQVDVGRGEHARWLVQARDGQQQGTQWHIYNPATGTLLALFDDAAHDARRNHAVVPIAVDMLARKLPVDWLASDGMRLHGFVYVPPGHDTRRLPLVVLPHGGPWNHWKPEYNGISQFLANRGYIVFEPNFRGSTGHGRHYLLAAADDFGNGRVQRDIVDGTRAMLALHIGDPQRVGIVGASFGGYSTLLGVTFQPDLFKVGVAFVPPPDFAWTLRWFLRNPESMGFGTLVPLKQWLKLAALDVDDKATMARLREQSPLANVASMNRPLLLVAGGEDKRVGIAGVVEYAARLKLAGKDVGLVVDAQAGHSNRLPLAREGNLFLLETMLHRYLGGAVPQPADAELKAYVRERLRLPGSAFADLAAKNETRKWGSE